jgi:exosortase/archaeosortase family protein
LRRRYRWFRTAALLAAALLLGLAFNTLRIVAIAVATLQTDIAYGTIHEGLGTLVYLVAMGVVYGAVGWARPRPATSLR